MILVVFRLQPSDTVRCWLTALYNATTEHYILKCGKDIHQNSAGHYIHRVLNKPFYSICESRHCHWEQKLFCHHKINGLYRKHFIICLL